MQALPQNVYRSARIARDMLNQQPFTLECRARHEIVPVFERNLLGEKVGSKPIGYGYRLKSGGRRF
jgi:hypothetical protein